MLGKSTITFFVLATDLTLSLIGNSIGLASAYPQPDKIRFTTVENEHNDIDVIKKYWKDLIVGPIYYEKQNDILPRDLDTIDNFGTEVDKDGVDVIGTPGFGQTIDGVSLLATNVIQVPLSNDPSTFSTNCRREIKSDDLMEIKTV